MTSLLSKLRTITLSNLHTLLDTIIDMNSIGAVEQYVRDLRAARDQLDDARAGQRSSAHTTTTDIARLEAQHTEADDNINLFISDTDTDNDQFIPGLERQLMDLEKLIASKKQLLASCQEELKQFDTAIIQLDTKLGSMEARLTSLRDLAMVTKGKERAAKILGGIQFPDDTPDTDALEHKLQQDAVVTTNALQRTLGRVVGNTGEQDIEVQRRIALRKQKSLTGNTDQS